MTRKTLKELRVSKGSTKKLIKGELDKLVEGPTTSIKLVGGAAVNIASSPLGFTTVDTGLSALTGFSVTLSNPVTPGNGTLLQATPLASGDISVLVSPMTVTPVYINWLAIGTL